MSSLRSLRRPHRAPRTGLPGGITAVVGGAIVLTATALPWLRTDTDTGGVTAVGGFGAVTGDSPLAGSNLNDLLDGVGSFRPGLIGLLIGVVAVLAAGVLALVRPVRPRPFRVSAALLTVLAVSAIGWGGVRWLDPDPAGVLGAGEAMSGVGSWLTVLGGVLLLAAAGWLWWGRADPQPEDRAPHRGIQPGS